MNSITTKVVKNHLNLPKDFLRTKILSPTTINITDKEQTFLFKSLGDLLIASRIDLQNYMNSINYKNQLNCILNSNSNILQSPFWLNNRMLKHTLAYTSSLISQYKIRLDTPNERIETQYNITNLLKKPINVATMDGFKQSGITDTRFIDNLDENNSKIIFQSTRPSTCRINLP
jgi:hypothetical protein